MSSLNKAMLQSMCSSLGMPHSGNKEELAMRLLEHQMAATASMPTPGACVGGTCTPNKKGKTSVGGKPKATIAKKAAAPPKAAKGSAQMRYDTFCAEHAHKVIAMGITDPTQMKNVLSHWWTNPKQCPGETAAPPSPPALQSSRLPAPFALPAAALLAPPAPPPKTWEVLLLPSGMDKASEAVLKIQYAGLGATGQHLYLRGPPAEIVHLAKMDSGTATIMQLEEVGQLQGGKYAYARPAAASSPAASVGSSSTAPAALPAGGPDPFSWDDNKLRAALMMYNLPTTGDHAELAARVTAHLLNSQ